MVETHRAAYSIVVDQDFTYMSQLEYSYNYVIRLDLCPNINVGHNSYITVTNSHYNYTRRCSVS